MNHVDETVFKDKSKDNFKDERFFNIRNFSTNILENTKPTNKSDILEGVAFYSTTSINREWDILRTPWYQNNIQFKPKFRKHGCKIFLTF
jgi:hypothetical protein